MNYELTIYTAQGALSFVVVGNGESFVDDLIMAIDNGTVVLDTTDGTRLILSAMNVVAIEIAEAPPGQANECSKY